MTRLGLDYAGGRPNPAAIAKAGYTFTCRYLTDGGSGLPGKLLTPDEYTALIAAGVSVAVNYETAADRMRSGYTGGVADAQTAQAMLEVIGYPLDARPVYFSADWDATETDQVCIDAYLTGAASVIGVGRVGVYGSFYVIKRCLDNGTATWAWQATAWSGGQIEPRAHILQHVSTVTVDGVACDVNEALQTDFGQHPTTHRRERHDMDQLPATETPKNPNSPPSTWPQTNRDIGFDPAGGLEGGFEGIFGVQEWGGRTVDDARGFLRLASWITPTGLVPVSFALSGAGAGVIIRDHSPTVPLNAPAGATGLTVNFAAPGGAYLAEGRTT